MSTQYFCNRHWYGLRWAAWRWIMYAPLLSAGCWLMIEPALASGHQQALSGHLQPDTLCTVTAEPTTGNSTTAAVQRALQAPLERKFRHGHGTRIDCRRRDGQWQAVEQNFQLDDIRLTTRGNGDRTLRAWEDDRDNGIVRQRALELPAPTRWRSGSQPDTLAYRVEQRQTNLATCGSTVTGHCSARQTTDTWLQTTHTGVQLVQQRYINGTFAERVSWYLDY